MMNIPTPRFVIGDKVWWPSVTEQMTMLDCPDCKGTHQWDVISPAGERFKMTCPRCAGGNSDLKRWTFSGTVRELTIGSVRVNTSDADPVEYMCAETGIGSGNLYRESKLGATEEEARRHWPALIAARELGHSESLERDRRNHGSLQHRIDDRARWYTFETAAIMRAEAKRREIGQRLEDLFNHLAELPDYGGIEAMGEKAIAHVNKSILDDFPEFATYLEAFEHDRAKRRLAA